MKNLCRFFWGLVAVVASANAAGPGAWRIVQEGRRVYALTDLDPSVRIRLKHDMGTTKILSWNDSPQSKDVGVLVYESGVAGTTKLYRMERAVVIQKKNMEALGEFFWRMIPEDGTAQPRTQPIWEWTEKNVHAYDPESGEELALSW